MIVRLDTADIDVSASFGYGQRQALRCLDLSGTPNDLALLVSQYRVAPLQRALWCKQFEFAVQGVELVTMRVDAARISG